MLTGTITESLLKQSGVDYSVSDSPLDPTLVVNEQVFSFTESPLKALKLSPAQRRVAEFFLSRMEDCAFLPAAAIARQCSVSESTVVRFATSCGFSGFPILQQFIQTLVRDRLSITGRLETVVKSTGDAKDILESVLKADILNLEDTLRNIDRKQFDAAVTGIANAQNVQVLGLRTSASLASLFAVTLRYIGKSATELTLGIGDYLERLSFASVDDVLVAITFRSYTQATQQLLGIAHEKGIPIILITDSPIAPGTDLASVILVVQRGTSSIIESSTAPMSLINALAVGVAKADEARAISHLRANEELWKQAGLHGAYPPRHTQEEEQ